jgi:hypothetical protein
MDNVMYVSGFFEPNIAILRYKKKVCWRWWKNAAAQERKSRASASSAGSAWM